MKIKISNSVYFDYVLTKKATALIAALILSLFLLKADLVLAADNSAPDAREPAWLSDDAVQSDEKDFSNYTRTYIISAYYSPLPGQLKYVTGSYQGDIRLNGGGVHGADGTPVYPGMIAAPSAYAFGTKMKIPGIGTVSVHDRGGAIVHSGERGNDYDRLDVWMGFGDKGLQRALSWGKRTLDVTVYGVDDSIEEHIELVGYSDAERYYVPDSLNGSFEPSVSGFPSSPANSAAIKAQLFSGELHFGQNGEDVKKLQTMLTDMGYYNGDINGVFDTATYDAVAKFQVDEDVLPDMYSFGIGHVGAKTIAVLADKVPLQEAHAKAEQFEPVDIFTSDLKLGDSGDDVWELQAELKKINLLGIDPTGYYGEVTEHAVFKFQQIYRLVGDKSSRGAGIFGPITRNRFNSIVAARLETDRKIELQSAR
ncbi:peptidoglycan-binding protein [Patescibacteria group bacterium]|nr:peptidoglycan-binding protein [Patescibacteria group bacterium]